MAVFSSLIWSAVDHMWSERQIRVKYSLLQQATPPDVTPPTIGNYSPPIGTQITQGQTLAFDVTDETGLGRALVTVEFQSLGHHELAHDGDSFTSAYADGSSRSSTAGGYHYTLKRRGDWPSSPTVHVYAFDSAGNEGV